MNVNKLLKLVGPKLKQDELDVFLGEVLFADQSYGDSQVSFKKYRFLRFVNVVSISLVDMRPYLGWLSS